MKSPWSLFLQGEGRSGRFGTIRDDFLGAQAQFAIEFAQSVMTFYFVVDKNIDDFPKDDREISPFWAIFAGREIKVSGSAQFVMTFGNAGTIDDDFCFLGSLILPLKRRHNFLWFDTIRDDFHTIHDDSRTIRDDFNTIRDDFNTIGDDFRGRYIIKRKR